MNTFNKRLINTLDIFFYSDIQFEYIDNDIQIVYNSIIHNFDIIKLEYSEDHNRINLLVSSGISLFIMSLIGYTI